MKTTADLRIPFGTPEIRPGANVKGVSDNRYRAKMVETASELTDVLALRYEVFRRELGGGAESDRFAAPLDFDEFDLKCEHIIVTEIASGRAVGTYRLNTMETALGPSGFYASSEFSVEDLPARVLENAVELGRACISKDHRNSRVLFLLWKVLANYLVETGKSYPFGCCSIFTQDPGTAAKVLQQLKTGGHMHESLRVLPRADKAIIPEGYKTEGLPAVELPPLVNIYLRIGAKVCGPPAIDREMRTVDFFVVFDLGSIDSRYRRMFFS